jgi:hypothetical protein
MRDPKGFETPIAVRYMNGGKPEVNLYFTVAENFSPCMLPPNRIGELMTAPPETSLFERTKALVEAAPRHITLTVMARETGLTVSWISRFAAGKFPNPGVHHVQALHDYLAGLHS